MSDKHLPAGYERSVERPVALIERALSMILGAGLAVSLIVKVYMLVLTDHVCVMEGEGIASLGNVIRCTGPLEMIAGFVAVAAGLATATAFFSRDGGAWLRIVGLAGVATMISALSLAFEGDYNWRLSLALMAILTVSCVAFAVSKGGLSALWRGDGGG